MVRRFGGVRFGWVAIACALAACSGEPPCGVDENDEDIPSCEYKVEDLPDALLFCPGDQWGTPACESCGCTDEGKILCTEPDPNCGQAQ